MTTASQRVLAGLAGLVLGFAVAGPSTADGVSGFVFVPRTAIYPGDTISSDVLVAVQNQSGVRGAEPFGSRPEDLVGKVARRTLLAGKPIPASAIREQAAVIQGRACDIIYKAGLLTISGTAVPLKSAAVGEVVSARNAETGLVVQAIVQAGGSLLVRSQ